MRLSKWVAAACSALAVVAVVSVLAGCSSRSVAPANTPSARVVAARAGSQGVPGHYHGPSFLERLRQQGVPASSISSARTALGVPVALPTATLGGTLTDMRTNQNDKVNGQPVPANRLVLFLVYDNGLVISEHADGQDYATDDAFVQSLFASDTEAEAAQTFNVGGHQAVGWDSGTYVKKSGAGAGVWTTSSPAARLAWRQGATTIVITLQGRKAADIVPVAQSVSAALSK